MKNHTVPNPDDIHVCPKCGHRMKCPCAICMVRHGEERPWVWQENGEDIACGGCGYTMNANDWLDLNVEQAKAAGLWPAN